MPLSLRSIAALCAFSLLVACAKSPTQEVLSPGSVTVRIGEIDPAALESAVKSAPSALPARTELLVDALWQVGCLGAAVETPLPPVANTPDVVCSLPGRTPNQILVVAHFDAGDEGEDMRRRWSGVAFLPFLYQSLAVAPREHTFVFAAFGSSPRRTTHDYLARLKPPEGATVRAIVDLHNVDPASIWFSASDVGLRRDFISASLAVSRPLDSLRAFLPTSSEGRGIATLTIAAAPPGRDDRRTAARKDSPPPDPPSLHATARFVAVFLAYADETLRLRAEPLPPALPAAPAGE